MKFLAKRFLLSALGALGLATMAQAWDEPKGLAKADAAAVAPPASTQDGCNRPPEGCFDDHCSRPWQFVGGGQFLMVRPYRTSDPAFITYIENPARTVGGGPNVVNIAAEHLTKTTDFEPAFDPAFRLWLGIQSECGLGLRGSWFHYDQSFQQTGIGQSGGGPDSPVSIVSSAVNATDPFQGPKLQGQGGNKDPNFTSFFLNNNTFPDPGTPIPLTRTLIASSRLYIDTWDLEVTGLLRCGPWNFTLAGGVRYAYLNQTYRATIPDQATDTNGAGVVTGRENFLGADTSQHQFTGAGPTFAMEVQRYLGESNFALTANARGSLVVGRGRLRQETNLTDRLQTFDDKTGALTSSTDTIYHNANEETGFDVVSILELDLGVQWSHRFGNAQVFLRPSIVGQTYFNAGNSTSKGGDLCLFGFAIAAGVQY